MARKVKKFYSIVTDESDIVILHIYKSRREAANRSQGIADEYSEMRPVDVAEHLRDVRGFDEVTIKHNKIIVAKNINNRLETA